MFRALLSALFLTVLPLFSNTTLDEPATSVSALPTATATHSLAISASKQDQDQDSDSPLDSLTWLAGSWHGSAFGGQAEEVWTRPAAGSMIGMFRLIRDDRVVITEYVTIEERDEEVTFRFKHFDLQLESWEEEPLTFTLTESEPGLAVFEATERQDGKPRALVYRATDAGLSVAIKGWEGGTPTLCSFRRGMLGAD